jgi:hypothetical protein
MPKDKMMKELLDLIESKKKTISEYNVEIYGL